MSFSFWCCNAGGSGDIPAPDIGAQRCFGPYAGPEAVATVASAAERLGFHSVSVNERLLLPAGPDWRNEARPPESYVWKPIEMLTWAAAHTRRIRLATGIVNALFQPPVVPARRPAFTATGTPTAYRG
ncbi:LLM class flavin-dependent oxidoreductase [Streptomyces sp. NPDC056227]|uniref:LLM class flavin-dependent oxidoreductase n=1 Tax=Streptomyces sp. NPDC056227 TaxID=3345753 RepID=UPI0035D5C625